MNWYVKVLKQYADFNGRARRKEYWMFVLINFIISMVLSMAGGAIEFPLLSTIYSLAVLIPSLAVAVRRMHDSNRSGWFVLVPLYNLYLAVIEGTQGSNEYGPDPKGGNDFNSEAIDSHMTN